MSGGERGCKSVARRNSVPDSELAACLVRCIVPCFSCIFPHEPTGALSVPVRTTLPADLHIEADCAMTNRSDGCAEFRGFTCCPALRYHAPAAAG